MILVFCKKNILILLLFGLFLFHVIPYVISAYYNVPTIIDDVCFSIGYKNGTILDSIKSYYLYLSGRYTSIILLHGLNSLGFDSLFSFKFLPLLLFSLFFLVIFHLFRQLFKVSTQTSLYGLFIFSILFLSKIPSPSEGFFWYSSVLVYFLSFILFLFLLYRLYLNQVGEKTNVVVDIIIILVAAGSSETTFALYCSIVCLVAFYNAMKRNRSSFKLAALAVSSIAGFLLIKYAPSNVNRQVRGLDTIFTEGFFFQVLNVAFVEIQNFFTLSLFLLSVVFFVIFAESIRKAKWLNFPFYYLLIVSLIALFLPQVLSLIGTNGVPPRIRNVVFFSLLLSWFVWLSYLVHHIKFKYSIKPIFLIGLVMISGLLSIEGNTRLNYSDIKNKRISGYENEYQNRISLLKSDQKSVLIPVFQHRPHSLYFHDMENDSNGIWSGCLETYYGKENVTFLKR